MKVIIHIETFTTAAYHAIRPALVASLDGFLGVCNSTFSATIKQSDYAYLVDVVKHAAQSAGVDHSEYAIMNLQNILKPRKNDKKMPCHSFPLLRGSRGLAGHFMS